MIAEYTDGSLTKKYIYGPGIDNPVAMIRRSGCVETPYYYYSDALGSVRMLSDAAGDIVESYAYDPYGLPLVMVSAGTDGNWLTEDVQWAITEIWYGIGGYCESKIGNPYLFTGRRWDSMAGLYYYRMRDYSPNLGRFLQPDPAGYVDGMNLYAYVGNNPLNWIDPWGLDKGGGPDDGWPGGLGGAGIGATTIGGIMICLSSALPIEIIGVTGVTVLAGGGVVVVIAGFGLVTVDAFGLDDVPGEMIDGFYEELKDVNQEWQYYEDNPDEMLDDILGW